MDYWQEKNVRLRAVETEDAALFCRWNLDSERARFLDFVWPPSSMASVQAWTAEQALHKFDGDRFHWVIENLAGEPVGTISTHACDQRNGTFRYAMDVQVEHRRKGYASAAILLVLKYYFEELRYQKVTVDIHSDNLASIQLHRKLGFQLEGTLRHMMFTRGAYIDAYLYGLTAEEYHSLASGLD